MTGNIGLQILTILVLILLNGIFVMSEMAVISARKVRLQQKVNDGDRKAQRALKLAEDPNNFLSTVQIGITLIGILVGAVGGVALSTPLAGLLSQIPQVASFSQTLALVIVVVIITTLSLILGELVPKRLALHAPERISADIAGPMLFISRLFSPLINLLGFLTDLILEMFRVRPVVEPPVTEEEIQVLLDQGTQAGVFEEAEQDMVEGVFRLNDRRVGSVMTQRSEIAWLDIKDTPEERRQQIEENPYSRYPVCEDSLDNVIGIIEARDLLLESLHGEALQLKRNLQQPIFIPETALASKALDMFKSGASEMMLVVDEFGSVQGLLTIYDILEEIVGDIVDGEPQATQRQDGSWLLDGMLPVEDMKEIFNLRHLPDEDEYETLSGFVMMQLGRVPGVSDRFEWNGMHFEVMDMDGKRVDKVLVTAKQAKPKETISPDTKPKSPSNGK